MSQILNLNTIKLLSNLIKDQKIGRTSLRKDSTIQKLKLKHILYFILFNTFAGFEEIILFLDALDHRALLMLISLFGVAQ